MEDVGFNLSDMAKLFKGDMERDLVEFRKKFSQLSSEGRKIAKTGKCFYCNEPVKKYCNSHSIPASFLKNISQEGKLSTSFGVIDLVLLDDEVGVNKAGTFLFICRDCDSKIFKDYESKENYDGKINQKMLAQIAMKNYLKSTSKRYFELGLFESLGSDQGIDVSNINETKNIDVLENIRGFKRAKKVDLKCIQEEYHLFFNETLDYVVPMAFQHQVALAVDLENMVVNNLYSGDKNYKIQMLHISVFPMEEKSVVMMFIDKKDTRYRSFIKQFRALSLDEQLMYINYIIFCYSEEYYLSPLIGEDVLSDENLQKVAGIVGMSPDDMFLQPIERLIKHYSLTRANEIPNLLQEKHKLTSE